MFASDYRRMARKALKGKWRALIPMMLVELTYGNIEISVNAETVHAQSAIRAVFGLGVILSLLLSLISIGQYRVMGSVLRGERPRMRQLFPVRLLWKSFAMTFVREVLIFLQFLLLIVPGVIAMYRYAMASYLLSENPGLGPVEALQESRLRMKGHKMKLFVLQLSFLGWWILEIFVLSLFAMLMMWLHLWPVAVILLMLVLFWVSNSFFVAYKLAAEMIFFRSVDGEIIFAEAEEAEGPADAPDGEPEIPFAVPVVDEEAAKDMYLQYRCSRNRMREDGVLADYEALGVPPSSEAAWRWEYGDRLMRRFYDDAAIFDELLALAAEYGSAELSERMLYRIERHIRQETLPEAEILKMVGRVLVMLGSGAFADREGFVDRKCLQISDMADRLEHRLAEREPDGDWRRTLELIRKVCGEA